MIRNFVIEVTNTFWMYQVQLSLLILLDMLGENRYFEKANHSFLKPNILNIEVCQVEKEETWYVYGSRIA